MENAEKLITDCEFELIEDHHSFGSGRYTGRVLLPADISACFPYLNAVLADNRYDHENRILIGMSNGRRYAFRPHEIQLGGVPDPDRAAEIVDEVVALVNRVWQEREDITPSTKERDLPTVIQIFQVLPRTNCRECGFVTCLACAAEIQAGNLARDACPCLGKPEYAANRERLAQLFGEE